MFTWIFNFQFFINSLRFFFWPFILIEKQFCIISHSAAFVFVDRTHSMNFFTFSPISGSTTHDVRYFGNSSFIIFLCIRLQSVYDEWSSELLKYLTYMVFKGIFIYIIYLAAQLFSIVFLLILIAALSLRTC